MSKGEVGLYNNPNDDRYEQRVDGRWYVKLWGTNDVHRGIGEAIVTQAMDEMADEDSEYYYAKQREDTPKLSQYIPTSVGDVDMNDGVIANMSVGNVDSDKKGSGARELGPNKDPLQWLPVTVWQDYCMSICFDTQRKTGMESHEIGHLLSCLQALGEFQEGRANGRELIAQLGPTLMVEACHVFEYGANKYKAWNWMKGMSWSVVVGCALRHAKKIFEGELLDDESGLPHRGHFACNLIMLGTFYTTYPEGNDFPNEEYFHE